MADFSTTLTKFHDVEDLRSNLAADLFCQRCSAFLSQDYEDDASYSTPWPHSRLTDIYRSAEDGCHLCSLLRRSIQETFPDEDINTPVYLFIKDKDILRIRVGSDPASHTPLLRLKHTSRGNLLRSISTFRQNICGSILTPETHLQIMQWVKECRSHHIHCRAKTGSKLPTRLLHISANNASLIESVSQTSINLQYMTLSHRWPKSPGMKLTKNTKTFFEQGIALKSLPPLFREVCEFSVSLGCSYLWIDALCIVQDDEPDWTREANLMVDVYVNSQLNIVAGASQQHEKLSLKRNLLMLTPCIITGSKLSQTLDLHAIFTFSADETGQIARLATEARAWILQECELSPRLIYFGDTELFWECSTILQSESSREGGVNWSSLDVVSQPRNLRSQLARFQQDHIGLSEARCCSMWARIVNKYTSLDITFETDRLVAISGLGQYLQHQVRDQLGEYYAGLWKVGFEQQLMWRPYDESGLTLSSTYLAPSWSWASHASRIAHDGSAAGSRSVSSFVENLKISATPVSEMAKYGRLKDGWLTCCANLCPIYLAYDQSSQNFSWSVDASAGGATLNVRKPISVSIRLDQPNQIQSPAASPNEYRDFFLVPLFCCDIGDHGQPHLQRPHHQCLYTRWQLENNHGLTSQYLFPKGRWGSPLEPEDRHAMTALILAPVSRRKGHYTRTGIAEFTSPDTIWLLQQACRQTTLPSELYVEAASDYNGYEIVVI